MLATVQQDDYQQKLDQANAQLAKAQAEHERAKLSFDRMSALYKAGAATQPDYDDSRAQDQSTQAAVDNAKAQIAEAQLALGYCELRAPFDSWVLKRNVDVGTLVGPATNGFTLADTRTVKAVFGVPDTAMGRIKPGSRRRLRPRRCRTVLRPCDCDLGRRRSQEPGVFGRGSDRQSAKPVEGGNDRLDHDRHAIAARRSGGGADQRVVRSPSDPNGFAVFVTEGSGDMVKIHTQDVTLGNTYGNMIAVHSGVNVGDRVVTSGTNMIKNGDEVRIIP